MLISLLVKGNSLMKSSITHLANRLFCKPFLGAGVSKPLSRTGTPSLPLPCPALGSHGPAACRGVHGPQAPGQEYQGGMRVSAAPRSSGRKDKCLQASPAPDEATNTPSGGSASDNTPQPKATHRAGASCHQAPSAWSEDIMRHEKGKKSSENSGGLC